MRRSTCIIGVVALLAFVACNRGKNEAPGADPNVQDKAGATSLTSAAWVSKDSAIDRIVMARCAREVTCSNLDPDRHFAAQDNCVREVQQKLKDDLGSRDCSNGIDGEELDRCVDALKTESCTNALDTVARLAKCRTGNLCRKTR